MITKYSQIHRSLPYFGIGAGFVFLCLAFWPVPAVGFELPKFIAVSALALVLSSLLLVRSPRSIDILFGTLPGRVFLGFVLVTLLSPLWSVAPIVSLLGAAPRYQGVLTYGAWFVLAIFAAVAAASKRTSPVVTGLVVANGVTVIYGIAQMMQIDPLGPFWQSEAFLGRVFSMLGHPNTLGQFILLTAPFVVLRLLRERHPTKKFAWGSLLLFNVVLLFGTVSRSALLGALVLAAIAAPASARILLKSMRERGAAQCVAFSLVAVLGVTIGLLFFVERFSLPTEAGRSVSARHVIFLGTLDMIRARPAGWGLETMAFTSPRFMGKDIYRFESLTTTIDRAHSEPLQILQALGPLGFVTYVSLILLTLLCALRYGKHDPDGLLRTSAAAILAYEVAVFFGFPSIATGAFFFVIIGLALGTIPGKKTFVIPWASRAVHIILVSVSIVALVTSVQWTASRLTHSSARAALPGDPSGAATTYVRGIRTFRYDREALIEATEAHLDLLTESPSDELSANVAIFISLLRDITGDRDGMTRILEAWRAAIDGDRINMDIALAEAEKLMPTSIILQRASMHIADILGDRAMRNYYRQKLLELLPLEYAEEDSELRRILLKQHPWLDTL